MGHHSYITIGHAMFMFVRDGYDPELMALFTEAERLYRPPAEARDDCHYGYFARCGQLRQRLQVQGYTAERAAASVRDAIERSNADLGPDWPVPVEFADFAAALGSHIRSAPDLGASLEDIPDSPFVDRLWGRTGSRNLLRFLLDAAPEHTVAGLDLHELVGCCVQLDSRTSVADAARSDQLAVVAADAPLIVLTEGRTDSRLLDLGMAVTHPHLAGFVKFIDFTSEVKPEGSVSALVRTVKAFAAAGVANRYVAIADNDTAARGELAKLTKMALPPNCRVVHYPDLDFLAAYPAMDSAGVVAPADINRRAGSLELYLGRDVPTIGGQLAPVHWSDFNARLGAHHGGLSSPEKKLVQDAFERKAKQAAASGPLPESDWTGVHAIIERLVGAFE